MFSRVLLRKVDSASTHDSIHIFFSLIDHNKDLVLEVFFLLSFLLWDFSKFFSKWAISETYQRWVFQNKLWSQVLLLPIEFNRINGHSLLMILLGNENRLKTNHNITNFSLKQKCFKIEKKDLCLILWINFLSHAALRMCNRQQWYHIQYLLVSQ